MSVVDMNQQIERKKKKLYFISIKYMPNRVFVAERTNAVESSRARFFFFSLWWNVNHINNNIEKSIRNCRIESRYEILEMMFFCYISINVELAHSSILELMTL